MTFLITHIYNYAYYNVYRLTQLYLLYAYNEWRLYIFLSKEKKSYSGSSSLPNRLDGKYCGRSKIFPTKTTYSALKLKWLQKLTLWSPTQLQRWGSLWHFHYFKAVNLNGKLCTAYTDYRSCGTSFHTSPFTLFLALWVFNRKWIRLTIVPSQCDLYRPS